MTSEPMRALDQAIQEIDESLSASHLQPVLRDHRNVIVNELLDRLGDSDQRSETRERLASLFYYIFSGAYDSIRTEEFQAANPTFHVEPSDVEPPTIEQATRLLRLGRDEKDVAVLESYASSIRAIFTDERVIPARILEAVRDFCEAHGGKSSFLNTTCRAILEDLNAEGLS